MTPSRTSLTVGAMMVRRAIFALVFIVLASGAARAQGRDLFTVAAVPVDATAANATAARDLARQDGSHRAYQILLARLTLAADQSRLPKASDAQLNELIGGFEVANERTSGVRYIANYTFHFRADAVRKLLRDASIPYCETPSKPLVVLALLEGTGAPLFWEEPNPWREAWVAHTPPSGLVPLVIPYGDLEDVQAIDADGAIKGDEERLQAVSDRYHGADILVAEASLRADVEPHTLSVNSTRFTPASKLPPQSWTKNFVAAPDQSDGDLLTAAVAGTAAQVEDAWKQANMLDYSRTGTIVARVPVNDLAGFVDIRQRLSTIPAIQRSELVSLDRQKATLAIHFIGDAGQLKTALAQRDIALEGQDPDWVLRRQGAAPPP